MTELETLERRISLVNDAIKVTKDSAKVDQVLSHNKHIELNYSLALNELTGLLASLKSLKIRIENSIKVKNDRRKEK